MDIFQQLEMQLYDEEFDPSYEPSQEDIIMYAEYLGIDP